MRLLKPGYYVPQMGYGLLRQDRGWTGVGPGLNLLGPGLDQGWTGVESVRTGVGPGLNPLGPGLDRGWTGVFLVNH